MKNPNQKGDSVTVIKNYDGSKLKYGKVTTKDKEMSTYEKAMHYMDNGTPKEGGVKKKGKPVTKSNAKGKLGKKNSRKRH